MKNFLPKTFALILIVFFAFGCSKKAGMTSAKLKLNLSNIVGLSGTGAGNGGAILFGRNSTNGHIFGKAFSTTSVDLELSNGAWVFYSIVWDTTNTTDLMNGKIQCAKTAQELKGADTSISLNLSNANCADPEFSEGRVYTDGFGDQRFADIFVEECDDVTSSPSYTCGLKNQGSGLSYRLKFQSFMKSPQSVFAFGGESIVSACKPYNSISNMPLAVNFPSGSLSTPFVVAIEIFLSKADCDNSGIDPKGVHQVVLNQGLRSANPSEHKVVFSTSTGSPALGDFTGTIEQKMKKCEDMRGTWDGSSPCSGIPVDVRRFAPSTEIASQTASTTAIKQIVQIPQNILCDKYIGLSSMTGPHAWAGGDGSTLRPYKICTEWQINQIGEVGASVSNSSSAYKLMRDLDMNKTDFGPYIKPTCVGVAGSIVDNHHNFNSLNNLYSTCTTAEISPTGFNGDFNGNGKTIRHARITAKGVDKVGFVRTLSTNGKIYNLNFYDLEVEGNNSVGGVAGEMSGSKIFNVKIDQADIRANNNQVGAVAGAGFSTSVVSNTRVTNAEIQGYNYVGGLIGLSDAVIDKSMFRGEITQHQDTSGYIGGLVGQATAGSSITTSYSEGLISSSLQYNGGIAGANAGNITDVYSTMYITTRYFGSNARLGGIAGDNTGSIASVYSDSALAYTGTGATPSIDGVSAQGTAPTACFATGPVTASACSFLTYAGLRNGLNFSGNTSWVANIAGALPRLAWESTAQARPCLIATNLAAVLDQITAGRGSAANPVLICSSDQLKSIGITEAAGKYFKLAEDISVADFTSAVSMVPNFAGILDGANFALYGLNMLSVPGANADYAIIKNNTGTISNLNLIGNKLTRSGGGPNTAILVGTNAGIIDHVYMFGNFVDGVDHVGGIAGVNTGTIKKSEVDSGLIRGQSYVGGVVGSNSGVLSRVVSGADISELAAYPAYYKIGGVAGANMSGASIDQALFDGEINFSIVSTVAGSQIYTGGIAGYNAGSLTNAMMKNYGSLIVKNNQYIGGLVGFNASTGSVSTSLSLGKLTYADASMIPISATTTFNPIVGFNDTGTVAANNLYLENNIGSLLGYAQTSSCSGSPTQTCMTSSSFDNSNANFFNLSYGNSGNSLSAMIPMNPSPPISKVGDLTVATNTILMTDTTGVSMGMGCTGSGIPAGAIVTAVNPGVFVTLNLSVSMTLSSSAIYFAINQFSFLSADVGGANIPSMTNINFYKGHVPSDVTGAKAATGFTDLNNFSEFNIAYDSGDPATSIKYNELMEYHLSQMDNRLPTLTPPIWELEDGEGYPRLLQLENR